MQLRLHLFITSILVMKYYWIRTHWLVKKLFPNFVWSIPSNEKKVYLTFDDGPIPEITDFVLDQLDQHNAKATFFCIGDNIRKHPGIFKKIVAGGHSFGNHTFNHIKGWDTPLAAYIENVKRCAGAIDEITTDKRKLLRPPYAKITLSQSKELRKMGYKIIMWDVLSADFDQNISPQQCLENVIGNIRPGSIVIFHDSVKAFDNMKSALPQTLQFLKENGYSCAKLD
jgi:peptidoglycan/xylan/chitin deacetylase (PgdA/CDA1 family)